MLPTRKRTYWRTLNFWAFIILLLFSIFFFASKGAVKMNAVRNINAVLLFPIEKTISFVSNIFTLRRQNTELRKEIARVSLQIQRCANIRQENMMLRKLHGFKPLEDFILIPCEIIGKSPGSYNKSLVLDRGQKAGLRKNLPVIAAEGLIGKTIETTTLSSEMLTLYNRSTIVSALDLRSRVQGIVKWKGTRYLIFDDVPLHSDVVVGDTIITSGMGGIYPQGIFIGTVEAVRESPKEIVMDISVKPFVDFSLLEDAFVIKELKLPDSIPEADSSYKSGVRFDIFNGVKDPKKFGISTFDTEPKPETKKPGAGKSVLIME